MDTIKAQGKKTRLGIPNESEKTSSKFHTGSTEKKKNCKETAEETQKDVINWDKDEILQIYSWVELVDPETWIVAWVIDFTIVPTTTIINLYYGKMRKRKAF